MKRIYPVDTSIIIAFNQTMDETMMGQMAETAVVNSLPASNFWKNSHEVDLICENTPIEIKYKNKVIDKDVSGIKEFMRKFNARKGIVVTKDEEKTVKTEHGTIEFVPAWMFLLKNSAAGK